MELLEKQQQLENLNDEDGDFVNVKEEEEDKPCEVTDPTEQQGHSEEQPESNNRSQEDNRSIQSVEDDRKSLCNSARYTEIINMSKKIKKIKSLKKMEKKRFSVKIKNTSYYMRDVLHKEETLSIVDSISDHILELAIPKVSLLSKSDSPHKPFKFQPFFNLIQIKKVVQIKHNSTEKEWQLLFEDRDSYSKPYLQCYNISTILDYITSSTDPHFKNLSNLLIRWMGFLH